MDDPHMNGLMSMETEQDRDALALRVWSWLRGGPPVAVRARITGEDVPMQVMSVACAYPTTNLVYVITRRPPGTPGLISELKQIYPLIEGLRVSQTTLQAQLSALRPRFAQLPDKQELWTTAVREADYYDLPAACIMFCEAVATKELVLVLHAVECAPLDMVLRHFKDATRLFVR